jgi:hypothetical protein
MTPSNTHSHNGDSVPYRFCNERHNDVCRRLSVCEKTCGETDKKVDVFNNKLTTIILLLCGNFVGMVLTLVITFNQSS